MKNRAPRSRTEGGAETECKQRQSSNRFSTPTTTAHHRPNLDEPIVIADWLKTRRGAMPNNRFAYAIKHLPKVADVLANALVKAGELDLIEQPEERDHA